MALAGRRRDDSALSGKEHYRAEKKTRRRVKQTVALGDRLNEAAEPARKSKGDCARYSTREADTARVGKNWQSSESRNFRKADDPLISTSCCGGDWATIMLHPVGVVQCSTCMSIIGVICWFSKRVPPSLPVRVREHGASVRSEPLRSATKSSQRFRCTATTFAS